MKKLAAALILCLVLGIGGSQAYRWYQWEVGAPINSSLTDQILVHVTAGESPEAVGADLAAKGLIRDQQVWRVYLKLSLGQGSGIEAGDFALSRAMSMATILDKLEHSQAAQIGVTLPEGESSAQMAALVAQAGIASSADYLAATNSGMWTNDFLAARPSGADLEGYLFPDTYLVDKTGGAQQLVTDQLNRFGHEFTPQMREAITQANPARPAESMFNIVILASIVEREVNTAADRPNACSVYYNRLSINQPLQVDATVLWALGVWKKALTFDDLKVVSPYNTYLHAGLPPGPIGNPGRASLDACVNPANTDFLYYFTDAQGVTHFEKTAADSAADQQKYGVSGYP
ncbi:MAG TPA: endolytic transglycosylase MltG [Candidatus Dormibacteraeota bacterium]|nr:endolytic transglycosylase MltG [Candidatus Dormibacteraeota bacterium]